MEALNEAIIKAAVVDRLLRHHINDDAVLISEMVLPNGLRRADLAVANGFLHAFEIKSDRDTLDRLDGQLEAYTAQFDKVTLVVATRFVESVLSKYPKHVEVWEALNDGARVRIKLRRRGECMPVRSAAILGGFLRKTELAIFLRSEGVDITAAAPRLNLMQELERVGVTRLRRFVLSTVKRRYKTLHDTFMARRCEVTLPVDLVALRRAEIGIVQSVDQLESGPAVSDAKSGQRRERAVNVDRLRERYGLVAENIPQTVLLRSAA